MPIPDSWSSKLLSVLRIVTGLGFLQHGTMKFFHFPPPPPGMDGPLTPIMMAAGTLELVGGALIVIGLFTRPVAFKQVIRDSDVTERRILVDGLQDEPLLATTQVVGQLPGRHP